MKIKLRHKDKKFVRDVSKYFKLPQKSTAIPNDKIGLTLADLVELSQRIPNNVNHFSIVANTSGEKTYVVAYMGCVVIFNESDNTIVLEGSKPILFRVPKISVYLKPILLTKDFIEVVSTDEPDEKEYWYKLDILEDENKFISSQCPQCKADITIFQAKLPEPEPDPIEDESDNFDGPQFVKNWLDHMSDGTYIDYAPVSADDDAVDKNTLDKVDEFDYIVKCNRCGYSNRDKS